MLLFLFAIFLLLLLGVAALVGGWRLRVRSGIPSDEVVYSDTGGWQRVEEPLLSWRYGLVGRPDYLIQVTERGQTFTVPVEVKSRKRPPVPVAAHVLQLGVYCLLVEDRFQVAPPYGLLRYADATLKIPFTNEIRSEVLAAAAAIRRSRYAADVRRSHDEIARCRACGYRRGCGREALGVRSEA